MKQWRVEFSTPITLVVRLQARSEDEATDWAWQQAEAYLSTSYGDGRSVVADASLDGVGPVSVEEVT